MTVIGSLSLALNKENDKKIESNNNSEAFKDLMLNRYKQSSKRNAVSVGIDEFGYSELVRIYGYPDSERYARDPVAKSSIESTVFSVVKNKFVIKINPEFAETRKAKKLYDFMLSINKKLKSSYRQIFTELAISGIWYGKALSELIFDFMPGNDPDYPNFIYIKEIKGKFNGVWDLKEDAYNNVEAIESLINFEKYSIDKFILFIWNKKNGRNQGTGVYDSVWKFLSAKHILYKHMLIYVEKFASPAPFIKLPPGASDDVIMFCNEVVQNLYAGADILLPHGAEIGFLEAIKNGDNNPFLVLFNWLDSQINLAIKGTSGLSINNGTGSGTGSHASDKVKSDKEAIYEWLLQTTLEELWLEQICKPILKMNFDENIFPEKYYPIGIFEKDYKKDLADIREAIKLAFEKNIYKEDNLEDLGIEIH